MSALRPKFQTMKLNVGRSVRDRVKTDRGREIVTIRERVIGIANRANIQARRVGFSLVRARVCVCVCVSGTRGWRLGRVFRERRKNCDRPASCRTVALLAIFHQDTTFLRYVDFYRSVGDQIYVNFENETWPFTIHRFYC